MNTFYKGTLGAIAGICVGASFVGAANAEILFLGIYQVTARTASCAGSAAVGDRDNMVFHPADAPGNAAFSSLNRIRDYGAQSYALISGSFTSNYKKVRNVGIGWSDYTPDKPTYVLISQQIPANITASTPSITLVGKIRNIFGNTGLETCEVTFRFVGLKQLD